MKTNISPGYGIVSLFLAVFIICIVIFATISFSTARSDYKFSNKSTAVISNYYLLEEEIQRYFMQIDEFLYNNLDINNDEYQIKFRQYTEDVSFIEYDETSNTYIIKTQLINDKFIESSIVINDNDGLVKRFEIIAYALVTKWDDSLDSFDLWKG